MIFLFKKNIHVLRGSSGQVECSFDQLTENFSFKSRKMFAQCHEKFMKLLYFPESIFCCKMFLLTLRMQF